MALLDMLASSLTICPIVVGGLGEQRPIDRTTPEGKAVAFLIREVPRWSRENHCYSCHNNGDAARALYQAARAGYSVPEEALAATTRWLIRPENWDHNGGDGPIERQAAGSRGLYHDVDNRDGQWAESVDRSTVMRAAERLALDQAADGSWPSGRRGFNRFAGDLRAHRWRLSWPAAACSTAQPTHFRAAIERADGWLLSRDVSNVTEASVSLLTCAVVHSPKSADRAPPEP